MSFYRKAMWFYKSWQDYTQAGFAEAEKSFNPTDLDVDIKGKSFMITGKIYVVCIYIYNNSTAFISLLMLIDCSFIDICTCKACLYYLMSFV